MTADVDQTPVWKGCVHRKMQLGHDISPRGCSELVFVGVQCVPAGGQGTEMTSVSSFAPRKVSR